jgi:hypothetical protein
MRSGIPLAIRQLLNPIADLARPKRFELLTPRFVVWCSIDLLLIEQFTHQARLIQHDEFAVGRWRSTVVEARLRPHRLPPDGKVVPYIADSVARHSHVRPSKGSSPLRHTLLEEARGDMLKIPSGLPRSALQVFFR